MGDHKNKPEYPQSLGNKVAIPRLPKPEGSTRGSPGKENSAKDAKNRVSHACEPCRQRKTKCSGERPICRHCQDCGLTCYYADGKRDRVKNEIRSLRSKVDEYKDLLEEVSLLVDAPTQLAIYQAIGKVHPLFLHSGGDGSARAVCSTGPRFQLSSYFFVQVADGILKSGKNVPDHSHDITEGVADETNNTIPGNDSAATQISWGTNTLAAEMDFESPSYHIDDLDLFIVRDMVNPFVVPKKATADKLIDYYMNTIQLTYPLVRKVLLMTQYDLIYRFPLIIRDSKKFLGTLNAIFAIGAVYSRILNTSDNEDQEDHVIYFTRARALSFDTGVVYETPDLQQVQVAGLLAVYLMATNQTTRAWNTTSLAIRYAQMLKLHVQTEPAKTREETEMRARIWYAINSLKVSLAVMTGRHLEGCVFAMPRPMKDEIFCAENLATDTSLSPGEGVDMASLHGLRSLYPLAAPTTEYLTPPLPSPSMPPAIAYFTEHARVSRISMDAINSLHCPETMEMNWLVVQRLISDLDEQLFSWRANLPLFLDFGQNHEDQSVETQRMALAFHYHHTRMIINQPCLRRSDGRNKNETPDERLFNRTAALACLESAREMVKLLPPVPNPASELYLASPWWFLFHYLVSAGSVLITEIAIRGTQKPQQVNRVLHDARKLIYWLKIMGKENVAARRVFPVFSELLAAASPRPSYYRDDIATNSEASSPMAGVEITQNRFLPAAAITHNMPEANPGADHSRCESSISGLELVAYDDELSTVWGSRNYNYHPIPPAIPSPGIAYTPHQIHDIDVEESLSRRGSILSQQSEERHYYTQWDTAMDTVLGKRPYASMPYPGGVTNDFSAMTASDVQHSVPHHVSQLDSGHIDGRVGSIDGISEAGADIHESKDAASDLCPTMTFSVGHSQVTYQQISQDLFRRQSQVQMQQNSHHHQHDRSKKRRESPVCDNFN